MTIRKTNLSLSSPLSHQGPAPAGTRIPAFIRMALFGTGLSLAAAVLPLPASAEDSPMDNSSMNHGEMDHGSMNHAETKPTGPGAEAASSKAFQAANDRMHRDMTIPFTGKADVDFVRGMIAHHQGAIDMAKVVLDYGSDPEIRKLAEEIVAAQEAEITQMKAWLARNGG